MTNRNAARRNATPNPAAVALLADLEREWAGGFFTPKAPNLQREAVLVARGAGLPIPCWARPARFEV